MNLIETLFYVIGFFFIWGCVTLVAFVVDKLLHRAFGRGLFPKEFWQ